MQQPDDPGSSPDRRVFLSLVTAALAAVPLVAGLLASLRAMLAPAGSEKPERVPLCRLDQVPDDDVLVRSVSYRARRGPRIESVSQVVFVTKHPESGDVIAMSGECTHLSCPVQKRELVKTPKGDAPLSCPCHGGRFSRTGEPLEGPPKQPLRRLRIELPADGAGLIHLLEV